MAAARRSCAAAGRSAAEGRPGEGTAGAGACGAPRCSHGAEGAEWGAGSTPRARGVGRARRAARLERDPFRLQARVSFFVGSCCLPQPRGVDAWLRAARSAPGRALECVLPAVCRCWARGRASWRHAWHTLRTGGRRPAGCRGALPLGTPRSAAARACPPPLRVACGRVDRPEGCAAGRAMHRAVRGRGHAWPPGASGGGAGLHAARAAQSALQVDAMSPTGWQGAV